MALFRHSSRETPVHFHGRVVMITGGTAGVGRATAIRFARRGARVGLIARDPAGLDETRQELEALGAEVATFAVDVSDADAVRAAADDCETRLGPIDVWVNNAMATVFSPVDAMDAAEIRRVTEVTYLGYVYGTLASPRSYGNYGAGTSLFWIDPERDITFACLTAGVMGHNANMRRFQKLGDMVLSAAD